MSFLKPTRFFAASIIGLSFAGCQLTEEQKKTINEVTGANEEITQTSPAPTPVAQNPADPNTNPDPTGGSQTTPTPAPKTCFQEKFNQPKEQILRSVDLLFISDTSGSMTDNRVAVADGLHAFVGALPSNVDYRIGMMLAHGSKSPLTTGKLWTLPDKSRDPATGYPYVLDSSKMSAAKIQSTLWDMMRYAPGDIVDQGELGMYSLIQSLIPANVATAKAHGFFRSTAALAVIFISDENDICAVYPANPQTDTGLIDSEIRIRNRDCPNGIAAEAIINGIRTLQGDRPFIFGAVTNNDITKRYPWNDGYGWGYMDVIEKSHGISVDIEKGEYISGLSQIGQLVTRKLELITEYLLKQKDVDESSIEVKIDGAVKVVKYEPTTNTLHFNDAGVAESHVEVNYCQKQAVAPTPPPAPDCNGDCTGGGGVFGI